LALAQVAVAKTHELPLPPDLYLNLPRLGKTAVRVILERDGTPRAQDWLIEVENLDDVPSHYLCSIDPEAPDKVCLIGWPSKVEITEFKKDCLIDGGPEVYAIPIQKIHQVENHDDVCQD
jgi:hypothetical protein